MTQSVSAHHYKKARLNQDSDPNGIGNGSNHDTKAWIYTHSLDKTVYSQK
jgi:hypothetical protein